MHISKNKIKAVSIAVALITIAILAGKLYFARDVQTNNQSVIYRADTDNKIVSITIETHINTQDYTSQILDVLNKNNIKATFFLTGKWVEQNIDTAKKISEENHEIGNHSYSHKDMKKMFRSKIGKEIASADNAISKICTKEINLFKPPFSYVDKKIISAAERKDKTVVIHSLDSLDWKSTDVGFILNNIISNVKPGDIICFHNDAKHAPQAMQNIIEYLRAEGYEFVTAGEILNLEN